MGFHDRIGDSRFPFNYTGGEDSQAPVYADIAYTIGEVTFPLPA
jgi:hypothetical protein